MGCDAICADVDVPGATPLLWVIRDVVGLTGTKFGCGAGLCGCCTVVVDGKAVHKALDPLLALFDPKAFDRHVETLANSKPKKNINKHRQIKEEFLRRIRMPRHVEDNIAAASLELTADEVATINSYQLRYGAPIATGTT